MALGLSKLPRRWPTSADRAPGPGDTWGHPANATFTQVLGGVGDALKNQEEIGEQQARRGSPRGGASPDHAQGPGVGAGRRGPLAGV